MGGCRPNEQKTPQKSTGTAFVRLEKKICSRRWHRQQEHSQCTSSHIAKGSERWNYTQPHGILGSAGAAGWAAALPLSRHLGKRLWFGEGLSVTAEEEEFRLHLLREFPHHCTVNTQNSCSLLCCASSESLPSPSSL